MTSTATGADWCRVCGTYDSIEREDIQPKWSRRAIASAIDDPQVRSTLPAAKTIPLCSTCNRALGSEFENAAAPLLKHVVAGAHAVWSPAEQVQVARWVCFKDIEYVLARDEVENVANGAESSTPEWIDHWRLRLQWLRDNSSPPTDWHCRMLAFGSGGLAESPSSRRLAPELVEEARFEMVSFMPLGAIAFEGVFASADWLRDFSQATRNDRRFTRIWPTHGATGKVPRRRVHLSEWDRLQTDWNHVARNAWPGGVMIAPRG